MGKKYFNKHLKVEKKNRWSTSYATSDALRAMYDAFNLNKINIEARTIQQKQ